MIALLLTIVIEVIVAIFFGYRKKLEIVAIIIINLITNPLLNYLLFINNNYFGITHVNSVIILFLEIIVILVEWLLLRYILQKNPNKLFVLSLTMNFCSYIVGVLIFI